MTEALKAALPHLTAERDGHTPQEAAAHIRTAMNGESHD
ncbi:hypothetical protein HMPREF0569_1586 [Micrococcus luteus SK58]|nr:hypothetical protein HMPREF0569_1586 [Micrococcus luteus SK58]